MSIDSPSALSNPRAARDAPLPHPDPIEQLPVLILFPHSHCNCRCLMCDIWRNGPGEELSTDAVARWIPQWRRLGVKQLVLSGGEALMHSRLWEMCAAFKDAGIELSLLSSGLLLRRHADNIVSYCDEVIVSLDGPPALHDMIRHVPRAFSRLAEGVAAVKMAAQTRGARVCLSARCTVQRHNCGALREVVQTARTLGLERISFLAADVSSSAFNRPRAWDTQRAEQIALSQEDLAQLQRELLALEREHIADFASGFIVESPRKLYDRLYRYYAALLGEGEFTLNRCNAPWVSAVIETDGTVRPCFFQPPLGNLHQAQDLEAILNGPQARAWRAGLDVQRDATCRRCVCTLSMPRSADHQRGDISDA